LALRLTVRLSVSFITLKIFDESISELLLCSEIQRSGSTILEPQLLATI